MKTIDPMTQTIPEKLVPHFIAVVKDWLEEMKPALDAGDFEVLDPNHYVVMHDFLLPDLEQGQGGDIPLSRLIEKGCRMMMAQVPFYLNKMRGKISVADQSAIQYLFCQYQLQLTTEYVEAVGPQYFHENTEAIAARLKEILQIL